MVGQRAQAFLHERIIKSHKRTNHFTVTRLEGENKSTIFMSQNNLFLDYLNQKQCIFFLSCLHLTA